MSVYLKVGGLRDIEKALAKLPTSTSKSVARRVLKKQLKPVAAMANAFWPGSDDDVFRVTSRVARSQPQPKKGRAIVNMFVGAPGGAQGTPHAHLIEWGTGPRFQKGGRFTGSVAPQPMLGPAWGSQEGRMLQKLSDDLWEEIAKTMARRAARGK